MAAICMALAGFGYWALVAAAIISPAISTACMWLATGLDPRCAALGKGNSSNAAVWRDYHVE